MIPCKSRKKKAGRCLNGKAFRIPLPGIVGAGIERGMCFAPGCSPMTLCILTGLVGIVVLMSLLPPSQEDG